MAELTEDDFLAALEEQQALAEGVGIEEVPGQPIPQQAQAPVQEQEEAPAFTQWEDYKNDPRFVDLSPAQKQNLFDDWQNYATQYLAQSGALSTEEDVKYTEDYFTNIAKTDNLRKPIFNAPNYVEQLAQQAQSGFGAMEAGTAGYASALGMTDTATASDVISQKYREQRDMYVNPDLKKFTEEQLGFFGSAGRILTNPFDIALPLFTQSMASSAPAIALGAGAGAAGTLVGGPVGGLGAGLAVGGAASGVVDGVITFNQMVIEEVGKRGLDPANAQDVQSVLDDPKFVSDAVAYSAARGVVIGAAELATFGAGKYIAGAAKLSKASGLRKVGVGAAITGVETVGEGVGETGAQIAAPLATGKPVELQPGEIAAEMFVQAPGSIAIAGLQTARALVDANAPSTASEVTREAVQAAAEGKFEKVLGVQPSAATPTDAQKYYDGLSIAEKARVLGMAPNAVLTVEQGTFSSLTDEEKGRVQVDFDTETKVQQGPTVEEAEAKAREAFQPTEQAPAVVAEQPAPVAETPVPAGEAPVAAVVQAPSPTPVEIVQAKPIAEQETAPLEQVAPATAQVVAQEEVQAPATAPAPIAETPAPVVEQPKVEAPAPAPVQPTTPKLPRNLAGAKPRYKQFALKFANDIDRALYIVAQDTKSARDAEYLDFVMKATGLTEFQARAAGRAIRASLKEQANTSKADTLNVPQSDVSKPKVEAPAPAPAPVVPASPVSPTKPFVPAKPVLTLQDRIDYYKQRLEDKTLLDKAVTVGEDLLVPTGGKRKIGISSEYSSEQEAKDVLSQIQGKFGFENAKIRKSGLGFDIIWGDQQTINDFEKLSEQQRKLLGADKLKALPERWRFLGNALGYKQSEIDAFVQRGLPPEVTASLTPAPAPAPEAPAPVSEEKTLDQKIKEAADTQRGKPESVMMDVTMKLKEETASSPTLIDLLEHIGDLSNRAQKENAIGNVDEKIAKVEKYKKNNWGTLKEAIEQGYRENAEYRVLKSIPELVGLSDNVGKPGGPKGLFEVYQKLRNEHGDKIEAEIKRSKEIAKQELKKYVEAHEKFNKPVTKLGKLGKDAAIALGNQNFDQLEKIVSEMRAWVDEYNKVAPQRKQKMFRELAEKATVPVTSTPAPATKKLPPTKTQAQALARLGYLPADIEGLDRTQAKDIVTKQTPKTPTVEAPKEKAPEVATGAPAPEAPAVPPAPVSEPAAPKAEERPAGKVGAPVAPPAGQPTAPQTEQERLSEAEQKLQAKVGQVIAEADQLGVDEESVKAWLGPTPSDEKILRTRAVLRLLNLGLADVYTNIRKIAAKTRGRQSELTQEGGPKIKRVVFTTREEGAGLLSNPEDMNSLDVIYVNPDRLLSRLRADVTTDAADFFVKVLEEELLHLQHGWAAFDLFAGSVPKEQVTPENFKNFFRKQSEEIENSLTLGQIQEVVGKYAGIDTTGKTKEQLIQEFAQVAGRRGRLAEEYLRTLIQRRMLGDITEDKVRGLTPNPVLRSLGMIKNWLGKFVGETIPKKYANQTPVERYYNAVSDLIYGNTFAKIREARDEKGTAIPGKETLSASTDPMAVRRRFERTTYQKELVKKIDEDFGLGKPKDAQKGEIWAKTVGLLIGKFPTFKPDEVQSIVGAEIPNAVKFFDPNRGVLFTTYLYQRGWRSLLDARKKQRRTSIYESGRTDVSGSVEKARFQPLSEEIKKAEKPKNVTAEAKAEETASELEGQENAAEEAANNIVARDSDAVVQKYAEVAGKQPEEDQSFEEMMGPKTASSELTAPGFSPSQAAARDDLSKVFDELFASFPQEVLPNGETASREQDVFDFLFRANEMENPPTRKGIMEKYNLGHSRQYDRIVESVREKVANTLAENNIFSAGQLSASVDPIFYSKINRTVEESKQGRASGAQWKAMIKNSKLGVSLGEMGLVGVDALEDDKVYTKDEILSYLNANSIEAGEVAFIGDNTAFPDYQIDNFGEGYTEFFVTQKDKKNPEKDLLIETYEKEARAAEERGESQQVLDKLILDLNDTLYKKGLLSISDWRDGHPAYSKVKNPIVRVRSSVRTLPDGRRMLFLEEVQPPNEENQGLMPPLLTKNWRQIGMKWAIREATDRGLDLIGWTPGETQVRRYSLSQKLKAIDITPSKSNPDLRFVAFLDKDGTTIEGFPFKSDGTIQGSKYVGKNLGEVVGKALADKILNTPEGRLEGNDLEIGGAGLKKLYDEDLRNVVNGLPVVKKSGVRVGQSTLKIDKSLVNEFLRTPEYKELLNQQRIEVKAVEKKRNDNLRYLDQYFKETPVEKRTQDYMDGWNEEYDRTVTEFRREMDELDAGFREASNELFATFSQGKKDEGIDLVVPSLELTPEIKASVVKGQPLISASIDPVATQALRRSLKTVPEVVANLLRARTYFPYENKELLQKANDFVDANANENDIFQAKIALDRASETEVSNPERIITLGVIGKRLKDVVYALDQKIKNEGNSPGVKALRDKYSNDLYDVLSAAQDILSSSGQDLQAGRVFANLFSPEQMEKAYTKPIEDAQKKLLGANAEIQKLKALIKELKDELATKAVDKGLGIIATPEPEKKFYDLLGLFGDMEPNEQESFEQYLTRLGVDYAALMAALERTITASVDPVTNANPIPQNFRNLNAREAIKQLIALDKNFFSKLVNLRVKTGATATEAEVATAQAKKSNAPADKEKRKADAKTVSDFLGTPESEKPASEEAIDKDPLPIMVRLAKYASDAVTGRVMRSLGLDKKTTPKGLFDEMEKQVRKFVNLQFKQELDPQRTAAEDTRTTEQKLLDLVERIGMAEQIFNQTKANLQARLDQGNVPDADRATLEAAVNRTFDANKIIASAKEIKQLTDFKAEARKHLSQRGASVASLYRLIKERLPQFNDAQAKALSDLITANYNRLVQESASKQLNNILKRSLTKVSKQPKKEIDQLIELMNLGAFDEAKFYNSIADRFGLPEWDPAVVKEIRSRAEQIDRLPQGSDQRTVAALQLQGFMAQKLKEQAKGYAKAGYVLDVMGSLWKAGVLSGFGTQSVNLLSTAGNVGLELLTSAIAYPLSLARDNKINVNPGKFIWDVISTYLDNLGRAAPQEAMDAFATGFGRLRSENQKQITPLEAFSIDSNLPKGAVAKAKWSLNNYLALAKLVGRAMAAADTFNANIANEAKMRMQMRYLLMAEKGMTSQQADEMVKNLFSANSDMMSGVREQVDREAQAGQFGTLDGLDPKSLAYRVQNRKIEAGKRRRIAQLREQAIATEVAGDNADETVKGIRNFTEVATFNNNPTGALGLVGDTIARIGNKFKLAQPFTSFTRTVANVVNASLNYTPYGYARMAGFSLGNLAGNMGSKYEFKSPEGVEFYKLQTQATMGTLALLGLASLFWKDMKEPWDKADFAVTGLGPSDPNKRAQLRASGWAENSVKVTTPLGSFQFRHSDIPGLSLVLGGLGMLSDSIRYGSLSEADATTLAAYMGASLGSVVFEKNLLSGAKSLFDILKLKEDPVAALQKGAGQYVGGITNPGLFRWLAQTVGVNERGMVEQIDYRKLNSTVPGFLLGLTPVAIKAGAPKLNRLGEPVEEYPWAASTKRIGFFPEVRPHPVLSPLVGADLFVPGVSRLTKINVYRKGRPEQVRVDVTEDTYYDYAKYNGQYLKRVLTPARAKSLATRARVDREGAQDELQDLAQQAKKYAVDRIEAQIRTKGLGQ